MTSIKKNLIPTAFALLSSTAISLSTYEIPKGPPGNMFLKELDGVGLDKLIVFIALALLFIKYWERFKASSRGITHFLAGLFSLFTLIGQSYADLGNWGFIFANEKQFIIATVAFVGYFVLFDLCLSTLYDYLLSDRFTRLSIRAFSEKIERHYTTFAFCVIVLCWLPYFLPYLPGSAPYDGYSQINQAFALRTFSNHHPWVLSELYGTLMWLGRHISDNFGAFTVVLTMLVAQALCYATVCRKIKDWGAPFAICISSIACFAILPPFGAYAQAILKDGIFTALFALFFVLYADICIAYVRKVPSQSLRKALVTLFFVEMAVCLTRNNGIYMVLPTDVLLLPFVVRGQKKAVATLTLCVALGYFLIEGVIAPVVGVKPGSPKEMLSIPFQQTARYVKEYPKDVRQGEKKAINAILRFDQLAKEYNPECSDPVKGHGPSFTLQNFLRYIKEAWLPMLFRHPGVYLEATFHSTFGYYYPFSNRQALSAYQFYTKGKPLATGHFDIHYIFPNRIRGPIYTYAEAWRRIPGLAQTVNPGTYTWFLLIMAGFLWYCKEYGKILVLAAPALNVAVCIASPVNGLLRYALPLLACIPVMFWWCTEHLFRTTASVPKDTDTRKSSRLIPWVAIPIVIAVVTFGLAGLWRENQSLRALPLNGYLTALKKEIKNYTIFITVKDEASHGLDKSSQDALKALGLTADWNDANRKSYCAVIDGGNVIFEKMSPKKIVHKGSFDGSHSFSIVSAGYKVGNTCSISLDKKEFARNRRGLNIVVFDKARDRIVDTAAFNTHSLSNRDLW